MALRFIFIASFIWHSALKYCKIAIDGNNYPIYWWMISYGWVKKMLRLMYLKRDASDASAETLNIYMELHGSMNLEMNNKRYARVWRGIYHVYSLVQYSMPQRTETHETCLKTMALICIATASELRTQYINNTI